MNKQILKNYGIDFSIVRILGDKEAIVRQKIVSDQSFCLCSYLSEQNYVSFLEDEVLADINNALQGNSFDPDGGGETMFLTIGNPNSTFKDLGTINHSVSIPTADLKAILTAWVQFLKKNKIN